MSQMTDTELKYLPKAELHVHLEGTIAPEVYARIAARNGKQIPDGFIRDDGSYNWDGFADFLNAYDRVAECLVSADDYAKITHDYLTRSAAEGVVYTELIISPDHGKLIGLSFDEMLDGINRGADMAEAETGIICRLNVTAVRHFDHATAAEAARLAVAAKDRRVVGFGLAGNEATDPAEAFTEAYDIARKGGLKLHAHAGEAAGPDSIRAAIDNLKVDRIGHGVRAIEDKALMAELAKRKMPLEVCPTSNVATGVYPDAASHPLPRLLRAGIPCTISSDDPPFFACTIGSEYATAHRKMGLTRAELLACTRTALENAFCDEATRTRLLAKLAPHEAAAPKP